MSGGQAGRNPATQRLIVAVQVLSASSRYSSQAGGSVVRESAPCVPITQSFAVPFAMQAWSDASSAMGVTIQSAR